MAADLDQVPFDRDPDRSPPSHNEATGARTGKAARVEHKPLHTRMRLTSAAARAKLRL